MSPSSSRIGRRSSTDASAASAGRATSRSSAMPRLAGLLGFTPSVFAANCAIQWHRTRAGVVHYPIGNAERNEKCRDVLRRLAPREGVMIALRAAIVALIACTPAAQAADCPRADTLGTSRILSVDAAQ